MMYALPFLALLLAGLFAAYHRVSLRTWAIISVAALGIALLLKASVVATVVAGLLFAAVAVPLLHPGIRRHKLTAPLLKIYTRMLPQLSGLEVRSIAEDSRAQRSHV